jgi:predicted CxxxxCH...CXXCH cytochrome family protein
MRYKKFTYLILIIIGFVSYSCSDLKNDISNPASVTVHSVNSLNKSSQDFHGLTVKANGLESCKTCHAATFKGGTAGVSCSSTLCHSTTIAVHQTGILDTKSANYHGLFISTNKVAMSTCNECHGVNFAGGVASPACTQCHTTISVHKTGISDPASANFHGRYVQSLNWDMSKCKECHGSTYAGGVASPSCNKCHTNSGGPEACNTCHGSFTNPSLIAPPVDLNRNTDTKYAGVGAHSTHLLNVKIGSLVKCNECHVVPTSVSSAGHIDGNNRAEVTMTTKYSNYQNANGTYNLTNYTCSNTYCHGNFTFPKATSQWQFAYTADNMVGNNYTPVWNKVDGTQAKCGTCHGLPPTGHMASDLSGCATCHIGVVDKYGNIIDKTKHMDGKIEVFGN